MNAPGPGEADAVTALGWTEVDLSGVMKRPCYAFQRGNILFTTIPPARNDHQTERGRSASECTSTCSVNVANTVQTSPRALGLQPGTDFCEVCCGIRSPSFSRRAQSFTTHFCTRVQAKRNASVSSSSLSDQRAKSTDSAGTSTSTSSIVNQCRNLTKVSDESDFFFFAMQFCWQAFPNGKLTDRSIDLFVFELPIEGSVGNFELR